MVLRWKPVAIKSSSVGEGSRSPASCRMLNWSNGMLALMALITQSRYGQMERRKSRS